MKNILAASLVGITLVCVTAAKAADVQNWTHESMLRMQFCTS